MILPVVSPREVFVSSLAPGDQGKELSRLQVFARSGGLKLLDVDTGNPGLKAEIQPKSPGQFYEVVLRYAGGWKSGPISSNDGRTS